MSAYSAYVTDKDGRIASEVVNRKYGEDIVITVNPSEKTGNVSNLLTGACMEDVNHELYGGIWSQMIFGESFEEPATVSDGDMFKTAGGKWYTKENGSVLAIDNTANGPKLIVNNTVCSEGSLEADVKYSGEGAGFIIKVSSAREGADSFYGYEISLFNGIVRLGDHRNNYNNISDTPCGDVKANAWIKLTVEFTEDSMTVYVNGAKVTSYTDKNPLKSGEIGFRAWNASAEYKNIKALVGKEVKSVDTAALGEARGCSGMWRSEIKDAVGDAYVTTDNVFTGTQSQVIEMESGSGSVSIPERQGLQRIHIRKLRFSGHSVRRARERRRKQTLRRELVHRERRIWKIRLFACLERG